MFPGPNMLRRLVWSGASRPPFFNSPSGCIFAVVVLNKSVPIPMKKKFLALACLGLATALVGGLRDHHRVQGNYLEVRSCDVYTGPCVANAEMGLTGKEGMLVWNIKEGNWKGTPLDGLTAIAVVRTEQTLGDMNYEPRDGKAVLILDARATDQQQKALTDFVKTKAKSLVKEITQTTASPIEVSMGHCSKAGCASVKAGSLVEITTRCFGDKDHLCGNEETFYPPLTAVNGAKPAYTEVAAFKGKGLNITWENVGTRSAFIGSFNR